MKFPGAVFVLTTTGAGVGAGGVTGGVTTTGAGVGAGFSGAEFIAHSTPVAFCIKSIGSTLYFSMRS